MDHGTVTPAIHLIGVQEARYSGTWPMAVFVPSKNFIFSRSFYFLFDGGLQKKDLSLALRGMDFVTVTTSIVFSDL